MIGWKKQAVIGLTSRCIPVDTFWFATVNESHFLLNNKIKTHLSLTDKKRWRVTFTRMQMMAACHHHLFMRRPCVSWRVYLRQGSSFPSIVAQRWESCQSPGVTRRQERKKNNKSATCFSRRVRFKELNNVYFWLTQSEEDLSALNISIPYHSRLVTSLSAVEHWSEQI